MLKVLILPGIKPSVDLAKEVKGYKGMVDEGWIDNERASKELTGTKFSKNIVRIARQNKQKADALRPLLELKKEFGEDNVNNLEKAINNLNDIIESTYEEKEDENIIKLIPNGEKN